MTDPRIMDLMNQEIDGANSAAETRELQDHLKGHPESRRVFSEIRDAVGIFEKVKPLDLPSGLHEAILAATGPVSPSPRRSWRSGLQNLLAPVLRPAVAASFAAGLVVGLIALDAFQNLDSGSDTPSPTHLQGMAGQDQDTLSLTPVLVRTLAGPRIAGDMRVMTAKESVTLMVTITSKTPVTVSLNHPGSWSSTDFSTLAGQIGDLRVGHGTVAFETNGAGRWEISLFRTAKQNESMTLKIHHKGELMTEQSVTVQP